MSNDSELMSERWEKYREANSVNPDAREREISKMSEVLNLKINERVLEIGTGNGILTSRIAKKIGNTGEVVTTDVVAENIENVTRNCRDRCVKPLLIEIEALSDFLDTYEAYFDVIASIATLHHFDNRLESEKKGRKKIIETCFRALKSGGRIVVADPLAETKTARYFDAINNPRYCAPSGHPHDFFSKEELSDVFQSAGFEDVFIERIDTPWVFKSRSEASDFLHMIHNAKCSEEESIKLAEEILGFQENEHGYELGWDLFFLTAKKPEKI